jgi:hypothetical protein
MPKRLEFRSHVEADILVGAAAIEIALLRRLRAREVEVDADELEWNGGRGLLRMPEYVVLRVRSKNTPVVMRVFSRKDLAKAAHAITWHVQNQIDQLVYQCLRPISPKAEIQQSPQASKSRPLVVC